jgi:hypothetical protein
VGFLYTSFWRMAIFFLRDKDGVALSTSGYQLLNHDSSLGTYPLMVLLFINRKVSKVNTQDKLQSKTQLIYCRLVAFLTYFILSINIKHIGMAPIKILV